MNRPSSYPRENRNYDRRHRRRSARLRKASPFCEDCGHPGSPDNPLHADHLESAADQEEAGLPLRDEDYAVRCRSCNSRQGAAKDRAKRQTARTRRR